MSGFSINIVVISGNLTRDPELRSLSSGTSVCEIGVAVNERIKQGDQWIDRPNYFDVTVWGGMGEWVARSLHKGSGVTVAGRLRWESWEKDGQTRSKVKIVADSVVPRDGNGGGGGGGGQAQAAASGAQTTVSDLGLPSAAEVAAARDEFATGAGLGLPVGPAPDDDIPF